MARRDEGAYPLAVCDRGTTKPAGLFRENPPGDGSFARGLRWLDHYSPLRGCSGLAALAQAKILRRRIPSNFQTGSEKTKRVGRATNAMKWISLPTTCPAIPVLSLPFVYCHRHRQALTSVNIKT